MRYNKIFKLFLLAVILLSSCAKSNEIDSYDITVTAWTAWIKARYNELAPYTFNGVAVQDSLEAIDAEDGVYYSPIYDGDDDVSIDDSDQWVKIKYTARTMDGSVFATRYKEEAKSQGSWTTQTNYEGQYLRIVASDDDAGIYSDVPAGIRDAFLAMTKKNQTIRAYIPYHQGWSSATTFGYGYEGLVGWSTTDNFYMDIELMEVIDDIEQYGYDKVKDWTTTPLKEDATQNWGAWTEVVDDGSSEVIYFRVSDDFDATYQGDIDYESTHTISDTTKLQIYYELWTLGDAAHGEEPVLVNTNIKTVAIDEWQFLDYVGFAVEYTNTNTPNTYVDAINEVIEQSYDTANPIYGGRWVEAVFSSDWAYGEDGLVPEDDTEFLEAESMNDDDFTDEWYYSTVKTSLVQGYQPLYARFIVKIYFGDEEVED